MTISVLLPLALDKTYTYALPSGVEPPRVGSFVRVPLRKKEVVGVVWGTAAEAAHSGTLREVIEVIDPTLAPPLSAELMGFINWVARYTMATEGMVLKLAMPPPLVFKKSKVRRSTSVVPPPAVDFPTWSAPQKKALAQIEEVFGQGGYQNVLLQGITGSGKTEMNFAAIIKAIGDDKGKGQALLLLPEIALANEILTRFQKYCEAPIAIWHSAVTPAKRRDQWRAIEAGEIKIVIGARSALFLPFCDLKMIVVDEEHDEGFKQGDGVSYHARDMAIVRAHLGAIPILLSSATPCLETLHNVEQGKCHRVEMSERVKPQAQPPQIKTIDLREHKLKTNTWIADPLRQAVAERLARGEQSLLFLNRRGFAPLTLCRKCGHRFACPDCTAWLALHRLREKFLCHHCGLSEAAPKLCPQCGEHDGLTPCGPGIERIAEEVIKIFPEARTACLSRDLPENLDERVKILEQMKRGEIDILIGTQIIAKGHHFPKLTLAGVIDADLGLANADLRAAERCFHLLQQVAGRTGREDLPGTAFLQTYNPDHPVMAALASGGEKDFLTAERASRKSGLYPPYGKLAAVILSSENKQILEAYGRAMARVAPKNGGLLLGPAPAPIFRRAKRYRIRFLLKTATNPQGFLSKWLATCPALPSAVRRQIDIDPHSFL